MASSNGAKQPNILVIFGDDIGMWNLSCCSSGASFTIDQVMQKMAASLTAGR